MIPYLWQRPKRSAVNYTDNTWYERARIGHNPLQTFMSELCEQANLQFKQYTNHQSVRHASPD